MGVHADPAEARKAATQVAARLQESGHIAWFAGGCVRDEVLGEYPTDYDVATDATPDRIASLFKRSHLVGVQFGVVIVRDFGPNVEVATFRSDGPYSDCRRPDQVTFSDPESDAARRDLTINALFLDPLAADEAGVRGEMIHGHVVDYVGGLDDLRAGLIRAVGDPERRLAEDHLRALRAVRFAARFGFRIEPATAAAISRHASELSGVSRERIGDELRRMLAHPARAEAVGLLQALRLDAPVLQEAHADPPLITLRGVGEALAEAAELPGGVVPVALGAWAIDRAGGEPRPPADAEAVTGRWRRALCLSNPERDALAGTLLVHHRLRAEWESLGVAQRKRLAARAEFWGGWAILAARHPEQSATIRGEVGQLAATAGGLQPEPLLTGDELIGMGLQPGPRFKGILDAVYDAQLEGAIGTIEQARELARSLGV